MNLQKTENFNEILSTIQTSKQKAYVQVNTTLVELYWSIGKHISVKVKQKSWGKGIVQELANFIKEKEPNIKGFTARNMWMMKQFYETYSDNPKLHTLCAVLSWSHNRLIMALKTHEEREFYLILCSKKKYAVRELDRLIRSGTYERVMLSDIKSKFLKLSGFSIRNLKLMVQFYKEYESVEIGQRVVAQNQLLNTLDDKGEK